MRRHFFDYRASHKHVTLKKTSTKADDRRRLILMALPGRDPPLWLFADVCEVALMLSRCGGGVGTPSDEARVLQASIPEA